MLELKDYNFFIGVPDSRMKEDWEKLKPIPAPSEDVAIGVACGAYMAGKKPMVLMQNSGLHVDTIVTLVRLYDFPIRITISNRGKGDEIQHHDWYRITHPLLDLIGGLNETR